MDHAARAKRLQDRAEECRLLAQLQAPDARDAYLGLARAYESLAAEERRIADIDCAAPALGKLKPIEAGPREGSRIVLLASAGPKLAGRAGILVGFGATKSQFRVLLDGSKQMMTVHARFVQFAS